jgi:hypothetical protein
MAFVPNVGSPGSDETELPIRRTRVAPSTAAPELPIGVLDSRLVIVCACGMERPLRHLSRHHRPATVTRFQPCYGCIARSA